MPPGGRAQLQPAVAWATSKVPAEKGSFLVAPPFVVVWGGEDASIQVLELSSGRCLRTFRKHKATIRFVAAADDACLSACADGKVLYWTCRDGNVLHAANAIGAVGALACGRRVFAYADQEGVHKVSFPFTVGSGSASLEANVAEVCKLPNVEQMAWDERSARLATLQTDGLLSVVHWADDIPTAQPVQRFTAQRVEGLCWLAENQVGVFQRSPQSSVVAVVDVSSAAGQPLEKARPLRVFDPGTTLILSAAGSTPSILALEHNPDAGVLRLCAWNLRSLCVAQRQKARSGTAGLTVNCSVTLPFLRRATDQVALPPLDDRESWQDAFCAASGLAPSRQVEGGFVEPLGFLPRGKSGLELVVRVAGKAKAQPQILLLQVKEKLMRVVSQPKGVASVRSTAASTLEKVSEDKVYHADRSNSPDQDAAAVLEEAPALDVPEEQPAEPEASVEPEEEEGRTAEEAAAAAAEEETLAVAEDATVLPEEEATVDDLAVTQLIERSAEAPARATGARKKKAADPLRLRDLKGPKLRAVLEAREVLEDAHLLSAQRTGEVRTERLLKLQATRSTQLPLSYMESSKSLSREQDSQLASAKAEKRAQPKKHLFPPPEKKEWNWEEWSTWSAYSKAWTAHWKGEAIPPPDAPFDTHWLANPYLGHSPYQPWLNQLQPPHARGMKKAVSVPSLPRPKQRRMPVEEPAIPPELRNYDAKVKKLIQQSAQGAAAHYLAGLFEDKQREVLAAMDMPLAADSAWSYADEYREFEKQMELSEGIVQQTAKRKPQTVDPDLVRFQSSDTVPLFAHLVPDRRPADPGASPSDVPVYY